MSDDPTPSDESRWLRTGRMEAFSDGVFAIAITLLVLDLAVPSPEAVRHGLIEEWPMYMAYVVSFASIGAAWIEHSTITDHLDRAGTVLLRLNLLLLFFVSVLPFPTKMLGEFAGTVDAERVAVTIYGINLFAISGMTSVVWRHSVAERLIGDHHPEEHVRAVTAKLTPSLWFYVLAIGTGLLAPRVAVFLYLVIAFFLLIPFRAMVQRVRRRTKE
jgi:TMEM175 potassium channel family protein